MDFYNYLYSDFNLGDIIKKAEKSSDFNDMMVLADYYGMLEFCKESHVTNVKEKSSYWFDKAIAIAYKQKRAWAVNCMIDKWKDSTEDIGVVMSRSCFIELKHIADLEDNNEEEASACLYLSERYSDDVIVAPNEKLELEYLLKSANLGNTEAMMDLYYYHINLLNANGHVTKENTIKAFEWLRKAAVSDAAAMYTLATSDGVQDEHEKLSLIKKAAELNYISAIYFLAKHYEAKPCNEPLWKMKTLEQYARVYNCLSVILSRRISAIKDAIDFCKKHSIGNISVSNDERYNIKRLEEKLFKIYQGEVDANHNRAENMYQLAVCYENGFGTVIDKKKALEHYKEAALSGNSKAKEFLLNIEKANCYHMVKNLPSFAQNFLFWLNDYVPTMRTFY